MTSSCASCPSAAPTCAWSPERAELVRALIYPVPDPTLPFLGVHFTRTINGEVLVGPTAHARTRPRTGRTAFGSHATAAGAAALARELAHDGPLVAGRELGAAPRAGAPHAGPRSGPLRPRAHAPPTSSRPSRASAPRPSAAMEPSSTTSSSRTTEHAVHVRSAPSPGATASLAIARHVADQAETRLGL